MATLLASAMIGCLLPWPWALQRTQLASRKCSWTRLGVGLPRQHREGHLRLPRQTTTMMMASLCCPVWRHRLLARCLMKSTTYIRRGVSDGDGRQCFFVSIDGEGWRLEMLEGREGRGWKVERSCVPIRLIRRVPRPRLLHRQPRQSRSSTRNRPGGREQL